MKRILAFFLFFAGFACASTSVRFARVPHEGIQPQVAEDSGGTVHLVYFQGDPAAGDLFYCRSRDGRTFSDPVRVNSHPGTAVAIGNIRGARIAVGRADHLFVVWNGAQRAGQNSPGLFFTSLKADGTGFAPERNLIEKAYGLDGGSGIAADQQGRVYVFWHAPLPGKRGEANRRVWMRRSTDEGQNFEPERVVWNEPVGACACCSLGAYASPDGNVYVLFRSAKELVHRDIYLLTSRDYGASFAASDISPWNVSYCVMSSEAFASANSITVAAWETNKDVHFGLIHDGRLSTDRAISNDPGRNQKYPALVVNKTGQVLLAWTEGMKWKQGGSVHWQLLDSALRATGGPGSRQGVPVWSFIAAYTLPDGTFTILY
jgi:hypothetical protein